MAKYHCPALVDCPRADAREVFDLPISDDNCCPGCKTPLVLIKDGADGDKQPPKRMVLVIAGAVVVAAAAGGYLMLNRKPNPGVVAAGSAPASAVADASAASASTGMTPAEAETQALKQQGEAKLVQGDASGAEVASSKAAANELIKLAVAKMAQNKLDDAEKDLQTARLKDPKQSLVSYNMAVLRLRQGRTDDALKEFEACFILGFPYFDKMDLDSDLATIRQDKRFVDLVARYRNGGK